MRRLNHLVGGGLCDIGISGQMLGISGAMKQEEKKLDVG